ncbi:vitamin K epoxide reductase family protein [Leucobacter sp. cx-328]|uniref:vitamin K epoxide reductase family protein n=1 Tax=unclassified Leucobacter TaxID=2621730 RepID=UPI00165E0457|nr:MULTISPECIES: vitamin K epoxide reductase family protein [unclassified Leucobacter]MBC9943998.1 vitamin K epoxide reductase family protein [Leucobacter sp. cx-328]
MTEVTQTPNRSRVFPIATIVFGFIGLFAAFELITEYIKKIQEPGYIPNCNVSVLVTCGPNMDSWQGSIFGFSNTIIGVGAFMAPIIVGFAILAGARFANWFWILYRIGLALGLIFVGWLAYQSIYSLGTLCPWCMVVWAATIPLFWTTLFQPEAAGYVNVSDRTQQRFVNMRSWVWVAIALCYIIIAAAAQFRLDWFAEFTR